MKRTSWFGLLGSIIGLVTLLTLVGSASARGGEAQVGQQSLDNTIAAPASVPISSTFTYQGQLKTGSGPLTAVCNFQFSLWDAASAGNQIGVTQTSNGIAVTGGLFTVLLNSGGQFGAAFTGDARWLQIAVQCGSDGGFTTLSPRQPLTAVPYALALPGLHVQQNISSTNLIGGYNSNVVSPTVIGSVIAGGGTSVDPNQVWADFSTVGGGIGNSATGSASTIGGGQFNMAHGTAATASGGYSNTANGGYSTVGGGAYNNAFGYETTVNGGVQNLATGNNSTIGGGAGNTASNLYTTVSGGVSNTVSGVGATIGGGGYNGSAYFGNTAQGTASTIGGGYENTTSGDISTVGGGYLNTASGFDSLIGGGRFNIGSGSIATVVGGESNTASGASSFVGGGAFNTASGRDATVPGGLSNSATMTYTFAAGYRAKANHQGAFVWGDSTAADFTSTANDQFLVRANGGVGIGTNAPAAQLHVSSSGSNSMPQAQLDQSNLGDYTRLRLTIGGDFTQRWDVAAISTTLTLFSGHTNQDVLKLLPGNPTDLMLMGNGAHLTAGGTWTNASDRNVKANFAPIDSRTILNKVLSLPISTWNYKAEDAATRHLGPMAQDFYAAFALGRDDKSIGTVDEEGVALAAIQGLYQVVQEKDQRITQLEGEVAQLKNGTANTQPFGVFNALTLVAVGGAIVSLLKQRRGGVR